MSLLISSLSYLDLQKHCKYSTVSLYSLFSFLCVCICVCLHVCSHVCLSVCMCRFPCSCIYADISDSSPAPQTSLYFFTPCLFVTSFSDGTLTLLICNYFSTLVYMYFRNFNLYPGEKHIHQLGYNVHMYNCFGL